MLVAAIAGELKDASGIPPITEAVYGLTPGHPVPADRQGGDRPTFLGTNRMGAIYPGTGWAGASSTPGTARRRGWWSPSPGQRRAKSYQHCFFGDVADGAFAVHLPITYYNPMESRTCPLARPPSTSRESRIDWNTPDVPEGGQATQHQGRSPLATSPVRLGAPDLLTTRSRSSATGATWTGSTTPARTGRHQRSRSLPLRHCRAEPEPVETLSLPPRRAWDSASTPGAASIGWERYRTGTGRSAAPRGCRMSRSGSRYRWRNDGHDRVPQLMPTIRSGYAGAVIEWRTIIARKWMRPTRIWTFQIDAATAIKGVSEQRALDILDRICLKKGGRAAGPRRPASTSSMSPASTAPTRPGLAGAELPHGDLPGIHAIHLRGPRSDGPASKSPLRHQLDRLLRPGQERAPSPRVTLIAWGPEHLGLRQDGDAADTARRPSPRPTRSSSPPGPPRRRRDGSTGAASQELGPPRPESRAGSTSARSVPAGPSWGRRRWTSSSSVAPRHRLPHPDALVPPFNPEQEGDDAEQLAMLEDQGYDVVDAPSELYMGDPSGLAVRRMVRRVVGRIRCLMPGSGVYYRGRLDNAQDSRLDQQSVGCAGVRTLGTAHVGSAPR